MIEYRIDNTTSVVIEQTAEADILSRDFVPYCQATVLDLPKGTDIDVYGEGDTDDAAYLDCLRELSQRRPNTLSADMEKPIT